jgi:hypothetical protein
MGEKKGGSECKKRIQTERILTQEKRFKEERENKTEGEISATGRENKVNVN